MATLPRKEIAKQALEHSYFLYVDNFSEAFAISNDYAPEHLLLQLNHAERYVEKVKNAGAVFIGAWMPETLGDYVTGANHVLPTNGMAKRYSGLSVNDFMHFISVQQATKKGFDTVADAAIELAQLEGLQAHGQAVAIRSENEEID